MKIFCFSATGNSLYVAKKIAQDIGDGEVISIAKVFEKKEFNIGKDNIIGFVYPIHCGSVPIIVEEFLTNIKIEGDPYIFAVGVTGGGGADLSFKHINRILEGRGKLSNYFTIKYISNYIRAGRNADPKRALKALEDNEYVIEGIISKIKNREKSEIGKNLGLYFLFYKLWKDSFKAKDKHFNCSNDCISCKVCKEVCPVNNIEIIEGKPKWNGKCIDCMACINLCPKKAINIGRKTINKDRYKNKNIKLEELKI